MADSKPEPASNAVQLPLVRGAPDQKLTPRLVISFLLHMVPRALFTIPFRLFLTHLVQFLICRLHVAQVRIILDRERSYDRVHKTPRFREYQEWLSRVEVNGTAGRWIARPGTQRKDDDVVIYYVHGGGFVVDTGFNSRDLFLEVAKEFNEKRNIQCSIFSLDYRLAPEFKYPSQIIETLAGYHYLVNALGISPSKIIVSGDSAGGNLVEAFLLHLARPSPGVRVPSELGPTPTKPAAALLISPFHNLASRARSIASNTRYDYIGPDGAFRAACDYLGVKPPPSHDFGMASLNPFSALSRTSPNPPTVGEELHRLEKWKGVEGVEGFRDPYANPSVQRDLGWWKEACPGEGKTVVCWGGKEILADDDEELFKTLEKAGVNPTKLYRPLAAHDWLLHDFSMPTSWQSKSTGPEGEFLFDFNAVCDLVERVAREAKTFEEPGAPPSDAPPSASAETLVQPQPETSGAPGEKSFAEAAASKEDVADDAPVVAEGEGAVLALAESGVMVEREEEAK
ncbi:hypothetical protein JCM6882_009030 [Rhodosporidiobolus microsporus]